LKIKSEPIKKGLNTAVNLVTEATLKLDIEATFPVPKNAKFKNNNYKLLIL